MEHELSSVGAVSAFLGHDYPEPSGVVPTESGGVNVHFMHTCEIERDDNSVQSIYELFRAVYGPGVKFSTHQFKENGLTVVYYIPPKSSTATALAPDVTQWIPIIVAMLAVLSAFYVSASFFSEHCKDLVPLECAFVTLRRTVLPWVKQADSS